MTLPAYILLASLLSAQSAPPAELGDRIEPAESSTALQNWKQGQQAMLEGRTEQAIASFQKSLRQDADLVCNHLSMAAAYLACGREEQAAEQLQLYLKGRPDHYVVRGQYAELLLRLDRLDDAREQFERFEIAVQDRDAPGRQHLIHCHSQLMDIAAAIEDEYGRHLHRGIGLYWLARQRADLDDDEAEKDERLTSEGLLCQAAGELMQARRQRPDEARPYWYLHRVWSCLGQHQPAMRWLRAAENVASFSYLTPAEQRSLHLACRHRNDDDSHK